MAYIYPPAPATLSGDVETISRFLASPTLVQRRLRTLAEQRYISDTILSQRFIATGGAVLYETGETITSDEAPRAVAPGAEYPLVGLSSGTASLAKTVKWGQDTFITDESIARRLMNPVDRAFTKMVNENVAYVDSVALSAISSAVTQSTNAAADWDTATGAQILRDALRAAANIRALNMGYDPDTIVIDDLNYANALAALASAGFFSRENPGQNPVLTSEFPVIAGLRWLPSPNVVAANTALVLDSKALGGMADEQLGGPGYTGSGPTGVEAKTMRDDDDDQWRLRVRRVTVPIILEPAAAWKIAAI